MSLHLIPSQMYIRLIRVQFSASNIPNRLASKVKSSAHALRVFGTAAEAKDATCDGESLADICSAIAENNANASKLLEGGGGG